MSIIFKTEQGVVLTVPCYQNLNLLAHAQLEELPIGSRCGGHGICGGDRLKVIEGRAQLSSLTDKELQHLKNSEIEAGIRLGCQAWPIEDDLTITLDRLNELS